MDKYKKKVFFLRETEHGNGYNWASCAMIMMI
jgi:hypothetical protein